MAEVWAGPWAEPSWVSKHVLLSVGCLSCQQESWLFIIPRFLLWCAGQGLDAFPSCSLTSESGVLCENESARCLLAHTLSHESEDLLGYWQTSACSLDGSSLISAWIAFLNNCLLLNYMNRLQHPKSNREKQGFWELTKHVQSSIFSFLVAFLIALLLGKFNAWNLETGLKNAAWTASVFTFTDLSRAYCWALLASYPFICIYCEVHSFASRTEFISLAV